MSRPTISRCSAASTTSRRAPTSSCRRTSAQSPRLRRTRFAPRHIEVDQLLEVPISHLLSPVNAEETIDPLGRAGPPYRYGDHLIFGATARVLDSFLGMLAGAIGREPRHPDRDAAIAAARRVRRQRRAPHPGLARLPLTERGTARRRLPRAVWRATRSRPLHESAAAGATDGRRSGATTGLAPIELPDIREYCFGEAQGMRWDQAVARWGLSDRTGALDAFPARRAWRPFARACRTSSTHSLCATPTTSRSACYMPARSAH